MSLPEVTLPGGARTTRLGFGCGYLTPEDARLLDVAYEAGIRHFDVAPVYGRGLAEPTLGRFLHRKTDVTVATKFGLEPPPGGAGWIGPARRILKPVIGRLRRLKAFDSGLSAAVGALYRKAEYTAEAAEASLLRSLRHLKRDRVDILLMHEARADDLRDEGLLAFLRTAAAKGRIGGFGVGGDAGHLPAIELEHPAYCKVRQYDWTALSAVRNPLGSFDVLFRVHSGEARQIKSALGADGALAKLWSREIGRDLVEPGVFEQLMLKAALEANPAALVLVSSSKSENILANARAAADPSLAVPALRLIDLARAWMSERARTT